MKNQISQVQTKKFICVTLGYYDIAKQLFKILTAENCDTVQKWMKSYILALAVKFGNGWHLKFSLGLTSSFLEGW